MTRYRIVVNPQGIFMWQILIGTIPSVDRQFPYYRQEKDRMNRIWLRTNLQLAENVVIIFLKQSTSVTHHVGSKYGQTEFTSAGQLREPLGVNLSIQNAWCQTCHAWQTIRRKTVGWRVRITGCTRSFPWSVFLLILGVVFDHWMHRTSVQNNRTSRV